MLLLGMSVFDIIANSIYFALAAVAIWGLFCIVVVWSRVKQKRFKTEAAQEEFLEQIEGAVAAGKFDLAAEACHDDDRALPQMIELALANRALGYARVRQLILDRFQRDVLADLEHRLSWVNTVIKSAPMIGLFGTVFGMMGAFQTLASGGEAMDPSKLANDINIALRTTACGLAIAVPLILLIASVNIRIEKMEDLVGAGLTRFLEAFKVGLDRTSSAYRQGA
ncbi:MotA/TolQ/ExbB proton channel family protein [Candidatus Laterigemmans baculatus]|uniref:MotA/TolQ/ExbB proton channel family protein n=1 Tax=Candidatus Laterigemmans baculatus TaxID=2770505 RepID=UPI0013DA887E|nr:MotA/TolQ/ExbB proton channel family protein [Candidatus Laterigemmans baculatus]